MERTIKRFVLHHSATSAISVDRAILSFDRTHKQRLHPNPNGYGYHIAYHFLVDKDGNIAKTRPLNEVGYHASNWEVNKESVGICMIGNFDVDKPTIKQLRAVASIIFEIDADDTIQIDEHRDFANKTCPGKNFHKDNLLFFLDPKNYHIYKEIKVPRLPIMDDEFFEYDQDADNCWLYGPMGAMSAVTNHKFSDKEIEEIKELAQEMRGITEGGLAPMGMEVVKEYWNSISDVKMTSWIFDIMDKKTGRKFLAYRFPIVISTSLDLESWREDKKDGVLDYNNEGKQGHVMWMYFDGKKIRVVNSYKSKEKNILTVKDLRKRLGNGLNPMGMTFLPEILI